MHLSKSAVIAGAIAIALTNVSQNAEARPSAADLIIKNAVIFTATAGAKQPSALAVKRGRIQALGADNDVLRYAGPTTKIIDAGQKLVMPGFHDSHVHLAEGGAELLQCRLNAAKSRADIVSMLNAYVEAERSAAKATDSDLNNNNNNYNASDNWILGAGLPLPAISAEPLDNLVLDTVSSTRPILVYSEDGHTAWLNSKAIELAGITATTPVTCGGIIELHKNGQPNGCLREGALGLVQKVLPVLPLKERSAALARAIALANSYGITSAQDAHANDEVLTAYYELARQGKLNCKMTMALHTGTMDNPKEDAYKRLASQSKQYTCLPRLRVRTAKIFADGVIESHTAALLSPYSDKGIQNISDSVNIGASQNIGDSQLNYTQAQLDTMVQKLSKRGYQIHVHAIGDRAVKSALDAFAKTPAPQLRHQIAHLQLVENSDLKRFKELNVTANCQCAWAFQDKYITELTAPLIGPERMARVYPFASLKNAGARLAAGSDWTVSTLNPLDAMQVAVTRQNYDPVKTPNPPLNINQALKLEDIARAYTTGGAYVTFSEKDTGSLELGKCADIVMLDKNIFTLPANEIASAKVVLTLLDGQTVYEAPNASPVLTDP
jgi:predicted amidohydrolase YtcJ